MVHLDVVAANRAGKPGAYVLHHCPACDVSAFVREGQEWKHGHEMLWVSAFRAVCQDCEWSYDRPRGVNGDQVRALHRAAHTHTATS